MGELFVPPISKFEHDHTYACSFCHEPLTGAQKNVVVNTETELKLNLSKQQIITELSVTTIERQDMEQKTRQPSKLWHQVTGSKCGRILCRKKYTDNLLISVLYPRPMLYPPKPIEWGESNEQRQKWLMRLA